MRAQRLLFAQLLIVLGLAVVTWFAVAYFLYWRIWWLDIPMHFAGGLWAACCATWMIARRGPSFPLIFCLIFALLVGVGWEIFEYYEGIAVPSYVDYQFTTIKDLAMDLLGATFGWVIARALV